MGMLHDAHKRDIELINQQSLATLNAISILVRIYHT